MRCLNLFSLLIFTLLSTLLATLVMSSGVAAIELKSQFTPSHVAVEVSDIAYPPSFIEKELDSGLPNTVSVYVTLTKAQQLLYAYTVTYQVVYDLWDEVYLLKQVSSDGSTLTKRFKTKTQLVDYIANFAQNDFYPLSQLTNSKTVMLKAQAIVNPVETERIKKIQAWIANSKGFEAKSLDKVNIQVVSNSPTGSVGARASTNSGPRFQKLFDSILAQYINSDELPALWRSQKVTVELLLPDKSLRTN